MFRPFFCQRLVDHVLIMVHVPFDQFCYIFGIILFWDQGEMSVLLGDFYENRDTKL